MSFDASGIFNQPLLDLGKHEDPAFRGVLSPRDEVGVVREGVNDVFLKDAEGYYKRYQDFDYWKMLCATATRRIGLRNEPTTIIEFGCGFGNATLPMLSLFPRSRIVATDISPNLLAILRRLIDGRGLQDRYLPVAMDAQKPYINARVADCVFGAAFLHHLAEPAPFVKCAMDVLKPGGAAFFFEPFEGGCAVVRSICREIAEKAAERGEESSALKFAALQVSELEPQIFRQSTKGWRDRDDKWAFPRSVLQDLADGAGAELTTYPIDGTGIKGQFRSHFTYMLQAYGSMPATGLPAWAWAIFDRYDSETFSAEMMRDLAPAGCIIFRRK